MILSLLFQFAWEFWFWLNASMLLVCHVIANFGRLTIREFLEGNCYNLFSPNCDFKCSLVVHISVNFPSFVKIPKYWNLPEWMWRDRPKLLMYFPLGFSSTNQSVQTLGAGQQANCLSSNINLGAYVPTSDCWLIKALLAWCNTLRFEPLWFCWLSRTLKWSQPH
jgi:hypothetical protein